MFWKTLPQPLPWKPLAEGETLIGVFEGILPLRGAFGFYEAILLRIPSGELRTASGVGLLTAVKASGVSAGNSLKISFKGFKKLVNNRMLREYRIWVESEDSCAKPLEEEARVSPKSDSRTCASPEAPRYVSNAEREKVLKYWWTRLYRESKIGGPVFAKTVSDAIAAGVVVEENSTIFPNPTLYGFRHHTPIKVSKSSR